MKLYDVTVDNLKGRSPVEVAQGASRIKLGPTFSSFDEFHHYLDSWCVMNGRSAHQLATKARFCLRVCHFGPVVRSQWRTPADRSDSGQNGGMEMEIHHSLLEIHQTPMEKK